MGHPGPVVCMSVQGLRKVIGKKASLVNQDDVPGLTGCIPGKVIYDYQCWLLVWLLCAFLSVFLSVFLALSLSQHTATCMKSCLRATSHDM